MRGQVSTEFLFVNAALLTLIIIMAAVVFENISSLKTSRENYKAMNALDKIYSKGLSVYYQGEGAKRTFFAEIPEDANMTYSQADGVLMFTVGNTQITKKFDYPFKVKNYPKQGGIVKFEVKNTNGVVELKAK